MYIDISMRPSLPLLIVLLAPSALAFQHAVPFEGSPFQFHSIYPLHRQDREVVYAHHDNDDDMDMIAIEAEEALQAARRAMDQVVLPPPIDPRAVAAAQSRSKAATQFKRDALVSAAGGAVIGAAAGVVILTQSDSTDLSPLVPIVSGAVIVGGATFSGASQDNRVGKIIRNLVGGPAKLAWKAIVGASKKAISQIYTSIIAIPDRITSAAQNQVEKATEEVKLIPSKVQSAVKRKVEETIEDIEQIPKNIADAAADIVEEVVGEIKAAPNRVASSTKRAVDETVKQTKKKVAKVVDDVVSLPVRKLEELEETINTLLETEDSITGVPKPPMMPPPFEITSARTQTQIVTPKIPPAASSSTSSKIEIPKIDLPKVEMPKIELPKVEFELPKIDLPNVDFPKVEQDIERPRTTFTTGRRARMDFESVAKKAENQKRRVAVENQRKKQEAAMAQRQAAVELKRKQEEAAERQRQEEQARQLQAEEMRRKQVAQEKALEKARQDAFEKRRKDVEAKAKAQEISRMESVRNAEKKRKEAQEMDRKRQAQKEVSKREALLAQKSAEDAARLRIQQKIKQQRKEQQKRNTASAKVASVKPASEARKANEALTVTSSIFGKSTPKRSVSVAPRGVPTLINWNQRRDGGISGRIYGSPTFKDGQKVDTTMIVKGEVSMGNVVQTGSGSRYFLSDTKPKSLSQNPISSLKFAIPGATITLTKSEKEKAALSAAEKAKKAIPRQSISLFGNVNAATPPASIEKPRPSFSLFGVTHTKTAPQVTDPRPTLSLFGSSSTSAQENTSTTTPSPGVKPRATFSLFGGGDVSSVMTQRAFPASERRASPNPVLTIMKPAAKTAPQGVPTLSSWRRNANGSITGNIRGSVNFNDGQKITTSPIASGKADPGEIVKTGSGSRYFLN